MLSTLTSCLGNNGWGKTTVLRATALAALSPVMPQVRIFTLSFGEAGWPRISLVKRSPVS